MGTLKKALRKGFLIQGGFEATLDDSTPVLVTAVLDRTGVYEVVGAPVWFGRHLATLDRFEVEHPELLTYRENKRWLLHANSALRGRNGTHPATAPKVKVEKPIDPDRCPGSNQASNGDPQHGKGVVVVCPLCAQAVVTYSRKGRGMFKSSHKRAPTESEGPSSLDEPSDD